MSRGCCIILEGRNACLAVEFIARMWGWRLELEATEGRQRSTARMYAI